MNILNDLLNNLGEKSISLDLDLVRQNITKYSNDKLCEMIVCDRYFGFEQKISSICMEELSNRRNNGDIFDFENKIELLQKELPVLDFGNFDIKKIMQKIAKSGKIK